MKAIPWSIVVLVIAVLGSCSFLVWDGKLDGEVLVSIIGAITGGGLLHLGSASASSSTASGSSQPPAAQ